MMQSITISFQFDFGAQREGKVKTWFMTVSELIAFSNAIVAAVVIVFG